LFVRWRLIVQACTLAERRPAAAFRESAALVRPMFRRVAVACLACAVLVAALALAASTIGEVAAGLVLDLVGDGTGAGTIFWTAAIALYVALRVVATAGATLVGSVLTAGVITAIFVDRAEKPLAAEAGPADAAVAMQSTRLRRAATRALPWALLAGLAASG